MRKLLVDFENSVVEGLPFYVTAIAALSLVMPINGRRANDHENVEEVLN